MIRTIAAAGAFLVVVLAAIGLAEGAGEDAAAAAPPQVRVTSAEGYQGGQVIVSLEGESGHTTFGAFTIGVVFDPSVVSASACTSDAGACNANSAETGVRVAGIYLPGLRGHAQFAVITFDVTGGAGASTPLEVQIVNLANGQAQDISSEAEVHDGEITVLGGPAPSLRMGDADCDGGIDSVDGLAILLEVVGRDEVPCRDAADVDCDGELDAVDALLILRFVAGLHTDVAAGCQAVGEILT
jgi:hypothetical protein